MPERSKSRSKYWLNLGLAVAFVAFVSTPMLVAARAGFPFDSSAERRVPYPLPVWSWATFSTFPASFEAWVNDHFGFRNKLIRLVSRVRVGLGLSPSAAVIVGKGGFLFYTGDASLETFRRTAELSDAALAQWRDTLEIRRAFLPSRGIRYLVVFNPDKETIYPELMPEALTRLPGPSPLDELLALLQQNPELTVVDTAGAVRAAKDAGQRVFERTDTHWNGFGRAAAANAVLRVAHQWFPALCELPLSELTFTHTSKEGGDLSNMLALPAELPETDHVDVFPVAPRAHEVGVMPRPVGLDEFQQPQAYRGEDASMPRAVVLGDSFMGRRGLSPLLAERFQRTLYMFGHELSEEMLNEQRPDIVIEGWVERVIFTYLPLLPSLAAPVFVADHDPPARSVITLALEHVDTRDVQWESGTWRAVGADPFISVPMPPLAASPTQSIVVDLQLQSNGVEVLGPLSVQLFFRPRGGLMTEATSVRFPLLVDERPHRYRVAPAPSGWWRGDVDTLRLDFPDAAIGVSYRVSKITIEDQTVPVAAAGVHP